MKEWTTKNKAEWGAGPWTDEPDKVQWVDEATGLDCLIVRNHGGALCGYVGVPESHPLFGVDYSQEVAGLAAALEARKERPLGESVGLGVMLAVLTGEVKASPEIVFDVHGGLTFADACHEPTRDQYESIPKRVAERVAEAAQYPRGDAARNLAELREQESMTFEQWRDDQMGRRICHVPEPGRPTKVWWFGFDCSHSGDYSPGSEALMREIMPRESSYRANDVYRDRAYVAREVASLAAQLADVR